MSEKHLLPRYIMIGVYILKKKKRKEIFVTYKIVCAKREESILRKNLKFTNYGSLFIIHQIA